VLWHRDLLSHGKATGCALWSTYYGSLARFQGTYHDWTLPEESERITSGISQPFVDEWSWRQADVAMIAENSYRYGFHLCYPEINQARPAGYVGTEFPLVPLLAAGLYLLFSVQEWVGRAVSVGFFLVSVRCLYRLVQRVANATSALLAVGIYLVTPPSFSSAASLCPTWRGSWMTSPPTRC
jgi:Dolichyl-phosphate-mannose-protein mannosyltransferase